MKGLPVKLAGLLLAALIVLPAQARAQTEQVEYYALDAIGSVRAVFDASGTVVARLDYEPFGRELSSSTQGPDRKFAALFRDSEAGLDYAEARSYQVRTGRFTAPDPVYAGLFDPQLLNRYSYALNNPVVFVDPEGLCATWVSFGGTNSSGQSGYCAPRFTDSVEVRAPLTVATAVNAMVGAGLMSIVSGPTSGRGHSGPTSGGGHSGPTPGAGAVVDGVQDEADTAGSVDPLVVAQVNPAAAAAAARILGQQGERAVRAVRQIGPQTAFYVNGIRRIADGMIGNVVSEVKNVAYQALTKQMADYFAHLQMSGNNALRLDLYVRDATRLSQPLQRAISAAGGRVQTLPIPKP